MRIILTADVSALGKAGDVVTVKEGYARNYLMPKGAAQVADAAGLRRVEAIKQRQQADTARRQREAQELAKRLSGMSCTISVRAQDDDQLFGSVSAAEIVKVLQEQDVTVDKSQIMLETPIKQLGVYQVPVRLDVDMTAVIKVWVVRA